MSTTTREKQNGAATEVVAVEPPPPPTPWEILRRPFDDAKIQRVNMGSFTGDYVGHADVTDRLLEADPTWTWEPLATDERGLPVFEYDGSGTPVGLWIKLTVNGVTRLGYGDCKPRASSPVKELIGDAIRNAAMRYGVALDLWSRSHDGAGGNTEGDSRAPAKPEEATYGLCPKCQQGRLLLKSKDKDGETKWRLSCNRYPTCDGVRWNVNPDMLVSDQAQAAAPPPAAPPAPASAPVSGIEAATRAADATALPYTARSIRDTFAGMADDAQVQALRRILREHHDRGTLAEGTINVALADVGYRKVDRGLGKLTPAERTRLFDSLCKAEKAADGDIDPEDIPF